MGLPRGVEMLSDEIRAALLPGERPLAYELVTQIAGHSAIGTGAEKPAADVSFNANPLDMIAGGGGIQTGDGWIESKIGGVNAAGEHGSLADQFSQAIERTSMPSALVTDRRLLIVPTVYRLRTEAPGPPVVPALELDRRAVRSVTRQPRLLQRARYRIEFVDGSWAIAMLGMFSTKAGSRFAAALGGPAH